MSFSPGILPKRRELTPEETNLFVRKLPVTTDGILSALRLQLRAAARGPPRDAVERGVEITDVTLRKRQGAWALDDMETLQLAS